MFQHYKSVLIFLLCTALLACGKGGNGNPANVPIPGTEPPPITPPDVPLSTGRQKVRAADSYAIYYGALDATSIQALKQHSLVIVHPHNGNIYQSQIRDIQQGLDPATSSDNVVVLCYISIGEDSRTFNLTDAQLRADSRFIGDGTGPSIDPRGAGLGSRSLVGLSPLGTPTNGGFASYYLNDNASYNASAPRNVPDQNPNFLTRYVNAGDPAWYDILSNELADNPVPVGYPKNPHGLKEMLTTTYGRGLGCDGVFLDTIDTAAPNFYAPTISNSEWTANGYSDFIRHLRSDYPDKVILQNRGIFYFDPRLPHYEVSARGAIDLFFFESYRLNSNSNQTFDPYFFPDNKHNFAPKLMAEANRGDGFKVISLGYVDGWGGAKPGIDKLALTGGSTTGVSELQSDIDEALAVGFRHYLTDASITLINPFVKLHANLIDVMPPQWSSTYNVNTPSWPTPAGAPVPRTGIQAVSVSNSNLTIAWDVAMDMNRVSYALYYQKTPFDFIADPNLTAATRVVLTPTAGTGYAQAWKSSNPNAVLQSTYPNQQVITGLAGGGIYYFLIRAFDSVGNEEKNQVVLSARL